MGRSGTVNDKRGRHDIVRHEAVDNRLGQEPKLARMRKERPVPVACIHTHCRIGQEQEDQPRGKIVGSSARNVEIRIRSRKEGW